MSRGFNNKRGSILAITALIIAVLGAGMLYVSYGMLARVTSAVDFSHAAYYAAAACMHKFDNYQPYSGNFGCTDGDAVDWTNSTDSSIVCALAGTTDTVLAVGSFCSCTTEFLTTDDPTTYSTVSAGKCNPTGTRTDDVGAHVVSIEEAVSKCPTCDQLNPLPPYLEGHVCGDVACGITCPGVCDTGMTCQAGICAF